METGIIYRFTSLKGLNKYIHKCIYIYTAYPPRKMMIISGVIVS